MVLMLTGMVLMLLDAFKVRKVLAGVAGAGIVLSMVLSVPSVLEGVVQGAGFPGLNSISFSGMIATGHMASMVHLLLCVSGLLALFFVGDYLKRQEKPIFESYALIVFALVGMSMLANARDLIITFIGLETMSICLYVMASAFKRDTRSNEAGLKYFLLGAFATGFFVYGIALIYGGTGTTSYFGMAGMPYGIASNAGALQSSGLFFAGVGMLIIGFLFKVSAFPFHAWTPDVYTGTPTPLAGFMATGSKAAAFIALSTFVSLNPSFLGFEDEKVQTVIVAVAVLTMIYGNIVAARQTNLKRMLAYSSIAHTGYVLLAVAAGAAGLGAVIYYSLIYTIMNIGAFGAISMAEREFEDTDSVNWKGYGRRYPFQGAAFSILLFSLAGIPPLAGFMAKYAVFSTAIQAGFLWPAIIGVLTSVVGAFYYIRVIRVMYFDENAEPAAQGTKSMLPIVGLAVIVVLVVLFGAFPGLLQGGLEDAIGGGAVQSALLIP